MNWKEIMPANLQKSKLRLIAYNDTLCGSL